ncbi:MAG: hypothetical protein AAB493_01675 [Patescibacteria group bacterium]
MKKRIIFIALISFTIFGFFNNVYADTTIHLDIETDTGSIYNQDMSVAPCDGDNDINTPDTLTAYCALDKLEKSGVFQIKSEWSGLWINSIGGIANIVGTAENNYQGIYWMWLVNLNIDNPHSDFKCHQDSPSGCSAKEYILQDNDNILFYYNINPLNISASSLNPAVNDNITISVKELGLDGWNSVWNPAVGGKIIIGSNTYNLDENGTYSLQIADANPVIVKAQKDKYIDSKELTITPVVPVETTPSPSIARGGGGGILTATIPTPTVKAKFDLKKSFEFIISQQKEDGSFGEDLYTDWTAIALASGNNQEQIIKLVKYFGESKITGTLLTDYERHAMALMVLGLNPYNTNGENYIKKITDSFDGKQFGNANEDNDDIFALIVLKNAGFLPEEKIIADDLAFVLNRQKENGSWDESVDMTGAAIQALVLFNQNEQVKNAIVKAKEFLKQNQKDTGGWNNVSSTAWAIGGILALSEKPEDWIKNNNTPLDYLALNQDTDGGIKNEYLQNRIWETAYTLAALSGKTWNQTMQKFEKTEELKGQSLKNPQRTVLKKEITKTLEKDPKRKITSNGAGNKEQKLKNSANQNVATAITAVSNSPTVIKTETPKRNWFMRFLSKIFGF